MFGSFYSELKRRKVVRVAAGDVAIGLGVIYAADVILPRLMLPDWTVTLVIVLVGLGFPVALGLAWAFDVVPDGVRRTHIDPVPAKGNEQPGDEPAAPDEKSRSIAVLPFENLSGTEEAAPFTAGLHDDLLTELSQISSLTVISRTSVRAYEGTRKTIPEVARELGVGTILEGTVQQSGDRVRLNVQLINARDDVHLWAERYDRKLTTANIFEIQTELAREIAAILSAKLTPEEQQRLAHQPTHDLEAYRQFARGRESFARRSGPELQQAAACFERAVERDPEYAEAWAGLANARIHLADYGHTDPEAMLPAGEEAARRAIDLDPGLAEAHSALGNLHSVRRQGPEAIRQHMKATTLRPGYGQAYQWLNWVRILLGQPELAVGDGRHAVLLDPLEPEARANLAVALIGAGDPESALAESRRVLQTHPEFDYARWTQGLALFHLHRFEEARTAMADLGESWAVTWPITATVLAAALEGNVEQARQLLPDVDETGNPFNAGLVQAALGEADAAFEAFAVAHPLSWSESLFVRYPPPGSLSPIEDDPRYAAFISELDRSWGLDG